MNQTAPHGLYIHIPYCLSRCAYCDFPSEVRPLADCISLIDALQIELVRTIPAGSPLCTIYLGGGTPSCLPVAQLARLLKAVHEHASLTASCEVTVEANPDTVSLDWAMGMHDVGVNRISLGVQTLSDPLLRRLGRRHTAVQAYEAYQSIRKGSVNNVSVDLMFGLPDQRLADWLNDVRTILSWRPEHISMYALTLEGDTPLHKDWLSGRVNLPDESETTDMMIAGAELLKLSGYEWYEVSNLALPGKRSRHNQLYWQAMPVAALGPGASGYDGAVRYRRLWPVDAWMKHIASGESTVAESERLTPDAALGEYLMLAFRTADGVSRAQLTARFGAESWTETLRRCAPLEGQGLIIRHDHRLHPTERGYLFHSTIAEAVL